MVRAENFWLLTINACNRVKVLEHLQTHVADLDVKIDDQTRRTTHLWVVGSGARSILDAVLPVKPSSLERCAVKIGSLMVARYIAMRVGYSNLWSIEVVVPNMIAAQGWSFITQKAGDNCVAPAGLAARDVLRIEAGLPRYGHELNETIDPITAGLERAVDFNHDFIGAPAIAKIKHRGAPRTRVGLVLYPQDDPQEIVIPTQGAPVGSTDEREVGSVTSGTFSPTLNRAIALGYTTPDSAVEGTELLVRVNSQTHPAVVTKLK